MDLDLQSADWGPIARNADDTLRVLDAGCGEAGYHDTLKSVVEVLSAGEGHEQGVEVWGVDSDPEAVEKARENNPGESFRYVDEALEPGNSYTPHDGDFDLVVSQHLLCETDNPEAVYTELERLGKDLKVDGQQVYNQVHSRC